MSEIAVAVGVGLLALDLLGGRHQQLTISDNLTTNMTVDTVTNVTTNCFSSATAAQTFTLENSEYATKYAQLPNSPYALCLNELLKIRNARYNLEEECVKRNSSYTGQVPSGNIALMMDTGLVPDVSQPSNVSPSAPPSDVPTLIGACEAVVNANIIRNVSQKSVEKNTANCSVSNTITNNISQNIAGTISAQLKNQQDFIGQLEGNLSGNTDKISNNIASALSENVTTNIVQSLNLRMTADQNVTIEPSGSLFLENVNQSFRGTQVGTLNMVNTVTNQIRQSATYSISQSLQNKNDTIGDLTKDYLQTINTMADLLEDLTTNLLIITALIIFAVIMVVGALFMFNKSFRSVFKSALGVTKLNLETKIAEKRKTLLERNRKATQ